MSRNQKHFYVALGALWLLAAQPGSVRACAACYGGPDSSMSAGLTWAITVMVGVVACVLTGVIMFFVRTARHAAADLPPGPPDLEMKEI